MSANPNPAVIPDGLWRLWENATLIIPGVRLGGIYAYKSGYHNTVLNNRSAWPNDYSIRLDIDNTSKPTDKARALDLTMDSVQMKLRTGYLQRAALHPDDNRLDCMREFYGTLNGSTVYGLSHDGPGQAWYSVSSDDSHLWHIHDSFFTPYVNDWDMLAPVLSVLEGVTWEEYQGQGGGSTPSSSEEENDMGLKGVLAQTTDEGSNSQVAAWIDPILGPVYTNIIDGNYRPMWAAMGFTTTADGGNFMVKKLAHLGRDFSAAQATYYEALKSGEVSVGDVNVTIPKLKLGLSGSIEPDTE